MGLHGRFHRGRCVASGRVELDEGGGRAELAVVCHGRPGCASGGSWMGSRNAIQAHFVEAADLAGVLQPEIAQLVRLFHEALEHHRGACELKAVDRTQHLVEHSGICIGGDAGNHFQHAFGKTALGKVTLNFAVVREEAGLHDADDPETLQKDVDQVLQTQERKVRWWHDKALLAVARAARLELEIFLGRLQRRAEGSDGQIHQSTNLCKLALGVTNRLRSPGGDETNVVATFPIVLVSQKLFEDVCEVVVFLHSCLFLAHGPQEALSILDRREDHLDLADSRATARACRRFHHDRRPAISTG
mmetsp:Transcript_118521/g.335260  ORF Transcript_118521/g.335260 Transcript_118521/m.335260 type:complete len:303 (-) Transcript_118521:490-1398(-)